MKFKFLFLFVVSVIFNNVQAQDILITQHGDTLKCNIHKFKNDFLIYSNTSNPNKLIEISIQKVKSFEHINSSSLYDSLVFKNEFSRNCRILKFNQNQILFSYLDDNNKVLLDSVIFEEVIYINFKSTYHDKNIVAHIESSIYNIDKLSFGIGGGIDQGGIGCNLLVYPHKNIGLFVAAGSPLAGIGTNVGTKIRFLNKDVAKKRNCFLLAMYGYNAAIIGSGVNEIFYGLSLGIGYDLRVSPEKNGYWSFAAIVPFRKKEAFENINSFDYLPVTFSISYKFMML